ncbi:biosynthetic-type acetolactate synthase large subunit [Thermogutta sp.]|uniref:biosynthetic-type acetolactate synthase large subunit n=1 Tax=Thermogutta sp. TaxID=1962930 RepID=UPI0032208646
MSTATKAPQTYSPQIEVKREPISGAEIVVQSLVNHGVEVVFAYPGGASMPIHQALTRYRDKIRVVLPRHEQGGGFAAQGYARSTGKVGVFMTTSGPGATNAITPLADAKLDSVPIIAITGQVGTSVIGTDAFQETPTVEVSRSITKHHYLVTDVNDLARVFKEAFYIASTGRPGPVLIDIPKNVQIAQTVPDYDVPMDLPGYKPIPRLARLEELREVARVVKKSRRPVIYAGGGVITSGAADALREFVEKTSIPVAMTAMGLGGFPGDHPLSLDMLGMHGSIYANYAVAECDLLLAFGARFDDRVTGKVSEFAKYATIVHIDIDPSELNKVKHAHIGIVSDLKYALEELNKIIEPPEDISDWLAKIKHWKETEPFRYREHPEAILPQQAIYELWKLTKDRDTIITTGVGQHQMWAAQFYKFRKPRTWLSSLGLGTMGFGLPAAMGAKIAHPDKLVIDIDGDGSFLMNIQEMATCYCEKIPVKVLLLNNQHLGMVVQWEDRFHARNRAHTYLGPIDEPEAVGQGQGLAPRYHYPDFVTIAKGFNWKARHIRYKSELLDGLKELIESEEPFLLDVLVPYQEHVLPMIPSGMTIRELIRE